MKDEKRAASRWERSIRALLLFVVLSIVGCDSGATLDDPPTDGVEGPQGDVLRVREIVDFTRFMGENDDDFRLNLDGFFAQTDELALSYAAAETGGAVEVHLTGERNEYLAFIPASTGESEIVVTAYDEFEQQATDTFHVLVKSPCPASPGEGEADYFPLSLNQRWVFDYEYSWGGGTGDPANRRETVGQLEWVVTSQGECARGEKRYGLREDFEGTTSVYYPDSVDAYPALWSETRTVTLRDSTVTISGGFFSGAPFQRIYPRQEGQVETDRGSYEVGEYTLRIEAEEGLLFYEESFHGSLGDGPTRETWQRLEE